MINGSTVPIYGVDVPIDVAVGLIKEGNLTIADIGADVFSRLQHLLSEVCDDWRGDTDEASSQYEKKYYLKA